MYKYYAALALAGLMILNCGEAAAQTAKPADANKKEHKHDHHGPDVKTKDLGTTTIAGVKLEKVTQEGPIIPGQEGAFDVIIAKGQKPPKALRAWIGTTSAEGSVKTRLEKEPNRHYHSHVEVPKPLPAGSQYWLEVEPEQGLKARAAFDFFLEMD